MALSLDDRLLGEKVHNYCSSSEGEQDSDNSADEDESKNTKVEASLPPPELEKYNGKSVNTGPKGVINDWRRFKQLENEKKQDQELEKSELFKKLTLSCRSEADDRKAAKDDQEFMGIISAVDEEFLKEYRRKRIEEMRLAMQAVPKFGKIIKMTKDSFIDAIDDEKKCVTVIIYIWEYNIVGCDNMEKCLICLAGQFPTVKFCSIRASEAKLSVKFAAEGCPALLIYKAGELIGNHVKMTNELGEDFFANDLEGFLLEHGMLPDKTLSQISTIHSKTVDSDSDFEID